MYIGVLYVHMYIFCVLYVHIIGVSIGQKTEDCYGPFINVYSTIQKDS